MLVLSRFPQLTTVGLAVTVGLTVTVAFVCTVAAAAPARALGQVSTPLAAAERAALERLALARARGDLHEALRGLPLTAELTVGQWAGSSVELDRALRAWSRGRPRHAAARVYSDGSRDADVRFDPTELREQMLAWQAAREANAGGVAETRGDDRGGAGIRAPGRAADIRAPEIRAAAQRWRVAWHTGSATRDQIGGATRPLGWENVSFEGIQLAQRAAVTDAAHALLQHASRLKVTNARLLADFLSSADAVRDAVRDGIERSAAINVRNDPDQVAVADASMEITDLIRILIDAHAQHYRGELFHAADFREMALLTRQTKLEAAGLAVPPGSTLIKPRYQPIELDIPAWAAQTLAAEGRYQPADDDAALDEAGLIEAARLDGMDALRRKVEGLTMARDVTIERFLAQRTELKDDVVTFLSGARVVSSRREGPDAGMQVSVELPLARLWQIVRRGMAVVETDPPAPP